MGEWWDVSNGVQTAVSYRNDYIFDIATLIVKDATYETEIFQT